MLLKTPPHYEGLVRGTDFICSNALIDAVSFTAGIPNESQPTQWLKFSVDGRMLYMARYALRDTVSYTDLERAELVSGNRTLRIKYRTYRIRLVKGIAADSLDRYNLRDAYTLIEGSEWNQLFGALNAASPELDLIDTPTGIGKYTWCQERVQNEPTAVLRDVTDWRSLYLESIHLRTNYHGWRPVLEEI